MAVPGKGKPRKAGGSATGATPASSLTPQPWKLRFSEQILEQDLREIGHAAFENARKAIQKKLPVDPHQYGEGLRPPLGGIYKLKSSHVRIAYHIQAAKHEVWVLMIGDRDVIWDRHEAEVLGRLHGMRAQQSRRQTPPQAG